MISAELKNKISEYIQQLLVETNHPELPAGDIQFLLHVDGAGAGSWANIRNNDSPGGRVPDELIRNTSVE